MDKVELSVIDPRAVRLLRGVLDLFGIYIEDITDEYVKATLQDVKDSAKSIVTVLGDTNPNDKEQINQVIREFLVEKGFLDRSKGELLNKVAQIKDERLRILLTSLLPVAFDIIKLLFDDNPNDEQQIIDRLKQALSGGAGLDVIEQILLIIIKDPNLARTIATLIISLIGGILTVERKVLTE